MSGSRYTKTAQNARPSDGTGNLIDDRAQPIAPNVVSGTGRGHIPRLGRFFFSDIGGEA